MTRERSRLAFNKSNSVEAGRNRPAGGELSTNKESFQLTMENEI